MELLIVTMVWSLGVITLVDASLWEDFLGDFGITNDALQVLLLPFWFILIPVGIVLAIVYTFYGIIKHVLRSRS